MSDRMSGSADMAARAAAAGGWWLRRFWLGRLRWLEWLCGLGWLIGGDIQLGLFVFRLVI